MSETMTAVIYSDDQAREIFIAAMSHAKALWMNGERVQISVGPALDPIGIQQRKFLHGVVLQQIAEKVVVGGSRFTVDVWKRYMKNVILEKTPKYEMVKLPGAKRATPRRVWQSTEKLGVRAYSKFIDECIDYAVLEWGVEFDFVVSEREAVRYVASRKRG